MIFTLILTLSLIIGTVIASFIAIRDEEYGNCVILFFLLAIEGICLFANIDAIKKDNKQVIEYRFPSAHYKIETVVTKTSVMIDDSTSVEKNDTTFVVTGVEPIIMGGYNYDKEFYTLEEYSKPLKSKEKKYVKD